MLSKSEIKGRARELGFADIGFTTADPFDSQTAILECEGDVRAEVLSALKK